MTGSIPIMSLAANQRKTFKVLLTASYASTITCTAGLSA